MAARGNTVERAASAGLMSLAPQEGLQALSLVLRDGFEQVAVAPIDWHQLARQLGSHTGAASASRIDRGCACGHVALPAPPLPACKPRSTTPGWRWTSATCALVTLVRHELATVLALPDGGRSIVDDQPFSSLGLDSLTSVELRNRLQRTLGPPAGSHGRLRMAERGRAGPHLDSMFGDAAHDDTREEVTL